MTKISCIVVLLCDLQENIVLLTKPQVSLMEGRPRVLVKSDHIFVQCYFWLSVVVNRKQNRLTGKRRCFKTPRVKNDSVKNWKDNEFLKLFIVSERSNVLCYENSVICFYSHFAEQYKSWVECFSILQFRKRWRVRCIRNENGDPARFAVTG